MGTDGFAWVCRGTGGAQAHNETRVTEPKTSKVDEEKQEAVVAHHRISHTNLGTLSLTSVLVFMQSFLSFSFSFFHS